MCREVGKQTWTEQGSNPVLPSKNDKQLHHNIQWSGNCGREKACKRIKCMKDNNSWEGILVVAQPVKKLPTFHETRNFITASPRKCLIFRNMLIFMVGKLLTPPPTHTHKVPNCRTTPCRLTTTPYSIYPLLRSVHRVYLLEPLPESAPYRSEKKLSHCDSRE
jgi:hypothetical protein